MTRILPFLVWVGTGLLWGTTWVVIRLGLRDLPPLTFAAARTFIAAAVLLAIAHVSSRHRRPKGAELRFWALLGLPQIALPYGLIFWAEQYVSAGLTAMLFATFPAFTAVFGHLMLRDERLTPGKLAGTLSAIVAVAILVRPSDLALTSGVAMGAVLLASLSGAAGVVLVRRHGHSTSTVWLTAIQVSAAAVALSVLAVAVEWGTPIVITVNAVATTVYLAIAVTVGCYFGLFWLLKRLDATFVSMGVIFETTVGVFLGAAVLGEPLGPRMFAGLALVGVSVYLVTVKRRTAAVGQ